MHWLYPTLDYGFATYVLYSKINQKTFLLYQKCLLMVITVFLKPVVILSLLFVWSHIPVRPELLNLRIQSVTVSESDCSGGADMRHIPFDIGTADGIC